MKAYQDRDHRGNNAKYHTGKPCIEKGCDRPAGTAWSPHWCFEHNVERMDRITKSLDDIVDNYAKDKADAERGFQDALGGPLRSSACL